MIIFPGSFTLNGQRFTVWAGNQISAVTNPGSISVLETADPIGVFGSSAWPNAGKPYNNDAIIQDGQWYQRANKIVVLLMQIARAVLQIQKILRQANLLT